MKEAYNMPEEENKPVDAAVVDEAKAPEVKVADFASNSEIMRLVKAAMTYKKKEPKVYSDKTAYYTDANGNIRRDKKHLHQ
jgi:hypothetical protein